MLRLSFLVVLVSLVFFCAIKENAAVGTQNEDKPQTSTENEYEPFMAVTTIAGILPRMPKSLPELVPSTYKLPSKLHKASDGWLLVSDGLYLFETTLCPELDTDDEDAEKVLDFVNRKFPSTEKCLFQKNFKDEERRMCAKQPTPVLEKSRFESTNTYCGLDENQQLIDVHFYGCGTDKTLLQYGYSLLKDVRNAPLFEPDYFLIYQICYDFAHKKTLWTKHTPMTPALLANPESPYKNLSNEIPISDFSTDTSSLDLSASTFTGLKKSYKSNDPDTSMIYTLVPKDHMALRYWKNATSHMINSAPLLPEFVSLMKAINNGILQASYYLFANGEETLQIYTQAETKFSNKLSVAFTQGINKLKSITHAGLTTPVEHFEPNIWYRLVYNKIRKSGVLIVLHNVRGDLQQEKECNGEERLACDFKSWSESSELIDDGILDQAYCCKISKERLDNLFFIDNLELETTFDIQETIIAAQMKRVKIEPDEDENDQ